MSGAEEVQTERWKKKRAWYDDGGTRGLDQASASAGFDAGWNAAPQPTPVGPQPKLVNDYPTLAWASGELCYLAADGTGFWKIEAMPKVTR